MDDEVRPSLSFEEAMNALAVWAADYEAIGAVYVFGSRVRGDIAPESDLDISVDLVDEPTAIAMETWREEVDAGFPHLCTPWEIHIHGPNGSGVAEMVRQHPWPVVMSMDKVRCLRIPAATSHIGPRSELERPFDLAT